MTDYFDAFTTIARRHAVSETRMDELVAKFWGRGEAAKRCSRCGTDLMFVNATNTLYGSDFWYCLSCAMRLQQNVANQIEDGAHTPPEDRPEEPKLVNGEWVHGVGCPCDECQRDAWVSEKEAERGE